MADPQEWYRSMPRITKFLFSATLGVTLLGNFGVVSPMSLALIFPPIWQSFQIWRPVTALFFHKLGFPFLINLYFLYSYSIRLEQGTFDRKPADYAYMLLFQWLLLVLIAFIFGFFFIGMPLAISILYVWCYENADIEVSFWFGTRFKARYLPWVLCGFNILLGGSGITELIGIIVGHAYVVLKYVLPTNGPSVLDTPAFFENLWYRCFPQDPVAVRGFGGDINMNRGQPAPRAGPQWGQGHRLGD